MSSIHPDYEYDIFISYRHNDNIDGWVTRFVEALQNELKATLKNEVSIYFDKNPHDGLLETHQVDASLAKKLKCLVFIPIISQTYCDDSCFAWEHEFLPFIELAKEDVLGMNITLSNGNVTSRVLPIKIHDLDTEDQNTLDSVLDGPLRSIDFIYREPGVNRPLNTDDIDEKNLNKTRYKNQLNKVANSLKDIGTSILNPTDDKVKLSEPLIEIPPVTKSNKKGLAIGLGIIGLAMMLYWGYTQLFNVPKTEVEDITIAVMAFDYQSSEVDQEWLGNGFPGAIRDVLNNVKGLQVIGKASSQSFKGKNATIKEIGEVLNANAILEGSVSKVGKKLRITVQLTDVATELQVWDKKYDREWGDINSIMDEIAGSIVDALKIKLSIEELENIKVAYEVNPEAYEYYLRGFHIHMDQILIDSRSDYDFELAEKMFFKAIEIDSIYAEAYAGLADLYDTKSWADSNYDKKRDSIAKIAYRIDPTSAYVLITKSLKFKRPRTLNLDSAFYYSKKTLSLHPNYNVGKTLTSDLFLMIGLNENAIHFSSDVMKSDPLNDFNRNLLAKAQLANGEFENAKRNFNKVIEHVNKKYPSIYNQLFYIAVFYENDIEEAKSLFEKIQMIDPDDKQTRFNSWLLAKEGKESFSKLSGGGLELYSLLNMKEEALSLLDSINTTTNYFDSFSYLALKNLKVYDFIRDEPEFHEIIAKAKKVHEERVAKYGHLFDED